MKVLICLLKSAALLLLFIVLSLFINYWVHSYPELSPLAWVPEWLWFWLLDVFQAGCCEDVYDVEFGVSLGISSLLAVSIMWLSFQGWRRTQRASRSRCKP